MGSSDVTLYPQFIQGYQISYEGNGSDGGIAPLASNFGLSGSKLLVSNLGTLSLSGSTFVGWNTLSNGTGTAYAPGQELTLGSADVVLYAQWTNSQTYGVNFYGNGQENGVDSLISGLPGQEIILGNPGILSRDGYTLSAWNTAPDGSGTAYSFNSSLIIGSADLELYAVWSLNPIINISFQGLVDETIDMTTTGNSFLVNTILNVTLSGEFDSYSVYINNGGYGNYYGNSTFSIGMNSYFIGTNELTVFAVKNGVPYSKTLRFKVDNA